MYICLVYIYLCSRDFFLIITGVCNGVFMSADIGGSLMYRAAIDVVTIEVV